MAKTMISNHYPPPVDPATVRSDWTAQGYSFHRMVDPPGQEWNNFVHDTDEYVIVAEGELVIDVGDERAQCGPGDLVRIPRGAVHSLKTVSARGSVWFYGYGHWENG